MGIGFYRTLQTCKSHYALHPCIRSIGIIILIGFALQSYAHAAGAASNLAFSVQPSNGTAGTNLAPSIQVSIQDANGNTVTTATNSVTIAIGTNPGSGALSGTLTVSAISGVATFSSVQINKAGLGYSLVATSAGLTRVTSTPFSVSPGVATKLAFVTQPANAAAAVSITPVVAIQDANGNTVVSGNNTITLALTTNPAADTLAGTLTVKAIGGISAFTLNLNKKATGCILTASAAGLTSATSTAFNITGGPAMGLAYAVQPINGTSGTALATVQVAVVDAGGNTITTATNSITVAIGNNVNGGTISGTRTVAAVSGIAAFTTLQIDKAGSGYTLLASASGLVSATSQTFSITAGTATKFAFTSQPANTSAGVILGPAVKVSILDVNGNVVTTATNPVTIGFGTNPGNSTLAGTTTVNAVGGVASFSDLSINNSGINYSLTAAGALTGATSAVFTVFGPPRVATAAGASPTTVTGTTTLLTVLGADDSGEANVFYTWSTTGAAPGPVQFSPNGTNAAKTCTATFIKSGTYSIQVALTNAQLQSTVSMVSVTVNQTLGSAIVTPTRVNVVLNSTRQFAVTGFDQFGVPMSVQPSFTWAGSGGGSIGTSGLFTAGSAAGGPYSITATSGTVSASAQYTVGTALSIVGLTGTISADTTLSANNIYHVTNSVIVAANVTLSIPAGTILKFDPGAIMIVNGTLSALGTSANKIYFTSWKDDTVGGDSNGDGSITVPVTGDWGAILPGAGSVFTLLYCEIRWSGGTGYWTQGGTDAAINAGYVSVADIENCVVANSKSRGIAIQYGSPLSKTWTVKNNIVSNSGQIGIIVGGDPNPVITVSGNVLSNNTDVGLYVPFYIDISTNVYTGLNGLGNVVRLSNSTQLQNVTWKTPAGSIGYYLDVGPTIPAGKTLTISPGTIVKIRPGGGFNVYGTLIANGTAANHIYFTSTRDDDAAVGRKPPTETIAAAPGDWGGISALGGSHLQVQYCEVRYGGSLNLYSAEGAIAAFGPAFLDVEHCALFAAKDRGIYATPDTANPTSWTIQNNTIRSNGTYGVDLRYNVNLTLSFAGNLIQNNQLAGIYMSPDIDVSANTLLGNGQGNAVRIAPGYLGRSVTWQMPANANALFLESYVVVPAGLTLTVQPGTVVKGNGAGSDVDVYGTLVAVGTASNKIYFTSAKDDALGGDTNVDGGTTLPARGDWIGVYCRANSNETIKYCEIRYAGYYWGGALIANESPVNFDVENCTITDSSSAGILGDPSRNGYIWTIKNNSIKNNTGNGIKLTNNSVFVVITLSGNVVSNNAGTGFYISPDVDVSGNSMFGNGQANAVQIMSAQMSRSATWKPPYGANVYSVDSTITIPAGMTLTITPGSIVKIAQGNFNVAGSLVALGTLGNKIYFTSSKDDSIGGDTNGDGSTTSPAPGNWNYIYCYNGCVVQLSYCEVRYAGTTGAAIYGAIGQSVLSVQNSVIAYSASNGINGSSTASANTLKNNSLQFNAGAGLYIPPDTNVSSNTFVQNGLGNAVRVMSATLASNATWQTPIGTRVYYLEGSVVTPAANTLTIPAGTVVKLGSVSTPLLDVYGTLTINGTSSNRVYLTSLKDDTVGGDTNGDGNVTTPAAGDWGGLYCRTGAALQLFYCDLRYGGLLYGAVVQANTAPLTLDIENCTISDSASIGITVSPIGAQQIWKIIQTSVTRCVGSALNFPNGEGATLPVMYGNTFSNNTRYGCEFGNTSTLLNTNIPIGNTLGGAYSNGIATDMRLCWWGDLSGPNAGAGTGAGSTVTGQVNYNPWRKALAPATPLIHSAAFDSNTFDAGNGTVKMTAQFDEATNWNLTVLDSSGSTVIRTYSGSGTSLSQTWDGKNSGGTVVPPGLYKVDWTATSIPNPSRLEQLRGFVNANSVSSIVNLTSPSSNEFILPNDVLNITGTIQGVAGGDVITTYDLQYGYGSSPSGLSHVAGFPKSYTGPVAGGLATFVVPAAADSFLTLRLTASTSTGVSRTSEVVLAYLYSTTPVNPTFSPNGDTVKDSATVGAYSGFVADWTINILNSSNAVIRTATLSRATTISYIWDGKDATGAIVPDGSYTLNLVAASPTNSRTSSNTIQVDNTLPIVSFTHPSIGEVVPTITQYAVTGTASDKNMSSFTLDYGVSASPSSYILIATSTSSVTNGLLALWNTLSLSTGTYTLRLRATDQAGNLSTVSQTVQVDRINFSNVILAFGAEFVPATGKTGTITFTVDKPATVVASIYSVSWTLVSSYAAFMQFNNSVIGSTPVKTISTTLAAAGTTTLTWDGRTSSGALVPDGCYIVTLAGSQTTSTLVGWYNPSYYATLNDVNNASAFLTPQNIQVPPTFSPQAGIPLMETYSLSVPAFASIDIRQHGLGQATSGMGYLVSGSPRSAGSHTEIWDGVDPYGNFPVANGSFSFLQIFVPAPKNAVIVNNAIKITSLSADPYRIYPLLNQVTTISYTLSRACNVTINVKDPNGNLTMSVLSNVTQSAGAQSLQWDGTHNGLMFVSTGIYKLEVSVLEPSTGITSTAHTFVQIFR